MKRGVTQEDFSVVSSRTYVGTLERGRYSPTLEKLDDLASVMEVHPVTLLVGCYALKNNQSADDIMSAVRAEIQALEMEGGFEALKD